MSLADWGTVTWKLFHTLAEKLKDEHQSHIPMLLNQIHMICHNLPCPTCKEHAIQSFKTCHLNKIINKEQLIKFLWEFHNIVNIRKKRNKMGLEDCHKLYKNARTKNIVIDFLNIFSLNARNEKGMMATFHRAKCINNFKRYLREHHLKFNY